MTEEGCRLSSREVGIGGIQEDFRLNRQVYCVESSDVMMTS